MRTIAGAILILAAMVVHAATIVAKGEMGFRIDNGPSTVMAILLVAGVAMMGWGLIEDARKR